jgi:AcrR family transcriptional regulator
VEDSSRHTAGGAERPTRSLRADAQRNLDSLLAAALEIFAVEGVDAPVRTIAERAGVGVGTVYRHFPNRSDLIVGVFRREVDACADAAGELAAEHPPFEALSLWTRRCVEFVAVKRGLSAALNSGDPAYAPLHDYLTGRLAPSLQTLLDSAAATGEVRAGIDGVDLLQAIASLCHPPPASEPDPVRAQRMVALLVDGLRYGAPVNA